MKETPWSRPRWINLIKINFRLHRFSKYSHLPEAEKKCERNDDCNKTR